MHRTPVVVALLLLAICFTGNNQQSRASAEEEDPGPQYVVAKYAVPLAQAQSMGDGEDAPSLEEQGYQTLEVPAGMTAEEYIAQLEQDPSLESAVIDAPVFAAKVPNDPAYEPYQAP